MDLPDPDRWPQIEALFAEAVALSPDERVGLLDDRDLEPALRRELERLLSAHDQAAGFLEVLDTDRASALIRATRDAVTAGESIGPYQVERRLGRGGMGEVWLAHDTRLERPVALKLLPPHRSSDAGARRRLADEARAASALDHPHIATVYDIGEAPDGRAYIAMAYYDGESLRDRIRGGPMELDEALEVARQMARGLAAAHAAGIVHRDVKPGNVVVTARGSVRILDFGIAKRPGPGPAVPAGGTLPYMSPEQTRGEDVDARSDVWSFGVVLYEMLAGRRPFKSDDGNALAQTIRQHAPESLESLRPDIPPEVARLVERCLEKDPDARWADAGEILAALGYRREPVGMGPRSLRIGALGVGAGAVVALGAVAVLFSGGPFGVRGPPDAVPTAVSVPPPEGPRIAVLPFEGPGESTGDDYLADGWTEALIGELTRLGGLRVLGPASVSAYRGTELGAHEVAGRLGVDAVLAGVVQEAGDSMRISVRLVGPAGEAPLWAEDDVAGSAGAVGLQKRLAAQIAVALGVSPGSAAGTAAARSEAADPRTYARYLRGRHVLNRRTEEGMRQSLGYFEEALALDPEFAPALAGTAQAHLHLGNYGFTATAAAYDEAAGAAGRALELDPTLPEAYAVLGLVHVGRQDFAQAEQAFLSAVALAPGDVTVRHWYGFFLGVQGRIPQALREVGIAHDLDPLDLPVVSSLARILTHAGDTEAALGVLQDAVTLEPGYPWIWYGLALVHVVQGDMDEAAAALEEALERAPGQPRLQAARAAVLALSGNEAAAREVLGTLAASVTATADPADADAATGNATGTGREQVAFELATIHAALGDPDGAFRWLDEVRWSSESLFSLRTDPFLGSVREDPRYARLLLALGL